MRRCFLTVAIQSPKSVIMILSIKRFGSMSSKKKFIEEPLGETGGGFPDSSSLNYKSNRAWSGFTILVPSANFNVSPDNLTKFIYSY